MKTADSALLYNTHPVVSELKERFGTPYYNLADPADPESMSEEELLSL